MIGDITVTRPDSFIRFREVRDTGKTKCFDVESTEGNGALLGQVRWHGAWRCYAFFPENDTLYETKCLTDIAAFLLGRMDERAASKGAV